MNTEKHDFYVYLHKRKDNNEVFYVGKGRNHRATSYHGRNNIWKEITANNDWYVEKYEENLDENTALDLELSLINKLSPVANVHKKDLRKKKLDVNFITQRYSYDETSPSCLVYKEWNGQHGRKRREAGTVAGKVSSNSYYTVAGGKSSGQLLAHRVVWFLVNGEDVGQDIVDHIDGNRTNNKIVNLRRIHPSHNSRNHTTRKDNSTGLTGVMYNKVGFFTTTWVEDNKVGRKNFSIAKFGEELALELACYYRLKVVDKTYSERHIGSFEFKILKDYTEDEINNVINDDLVANNTSGFRGVSKSTVGQNEFWVFRHGKNKPQRFSVTKYGNTVAKCLAAEASKRFFGENPSNITGFSLHETSIMLADNTKAGNLSGFKGLQFIVNKPGYTVVQVQKMINYKNYVKRFSCNDLGIIQAHALAMKWYTER